MSWFNVQNYPGWIYDEGCEDFISPSGRIADFPGATFSGQVTNDDLDYIVKEVSQTHEVHYDKETKEMSVIDVEKIEAEETPVEQDVVEVDGLKITSKTYIVGDIEINIVDVV